MAEEFDVFSHILKGCPTLGQNRAVRGIGDPGEDRTRHQNLNIERIPLATPRHTPRTTGATAHREQTSVGQSEKPRQLKQKETLKQLKKPKSPGQPRLRCCPSSCSWTHQRRNQRLLSRQDCVRSVISSWYRRVTAPIMTAMVTITEIMAIFVLRGCIGDVPSARGEGEGRDKA